MAVHKICMQMGKWERYILILWKYRHRLEEFFTKIQSNFYVDNNPYFPSILYSKNSKFKTGGVMVLCDIDANRVTYNNKPPLDISEDASDTES